MKALVWHGKHDVRVDTVPEPQIESPRDIIVKITSTAICGSDLHLYDGMMPTMEEGDILGHEPMGEVVGRDVKKVNRGDRVVIPFTIACGACRFCQMGLPPFVIPPIQMRKWRARLWASRRPRWLATRICSEVFLAVKPSIFASPMRT